MQINLPFKRLVGKETIWKIWVSVSILLELINLNASNCGTLPTLPKTNAWWVEHGNIIHYCSFTDSSVSGQFSQSLSHSCLLILGSYHTAHTPSTDLTVHTVTTNIFMLLSKSISPPKPSTESNSPALLSKIMRKIIVIWRADGFHCQCFFRCSCLF